MIKRVLSWYKQRKRAELLGRSHTGFWYDPDTGRLWQADGRYSLFTVPCINDSAEDLARMCYVVHLCTLTEQGEQYLPTEYTSEVADE